MLIRLQKGETLDHIAIQCGISKQNLIDNNRFEPLEGDYFVIPLNRKYTVESYDNPISVSRKTRLEVKDVLARCGEKFCAGKQFYY